METAFRSGPCHCGQSKLAENSVCCVKTVRATAQVKNLWLIFSIDWFVSVTNDIEGNGPVTDESGDALCGRRDDFVAEQRECFADKFLVGERTLNLGSVE